MIYCASLLRRQLFRANLGYAVTQHTHTHAHTPVAQNLFALHTLDVSKCENLTSKGIQFLATHYAGLHTLGWAECPPDTPHGKCLGLHVIGFDEVFEKARWDALALGRFK